jgi:hypothetical protein
MTQQELVATLFTLMSGQPWSPEPGVTLTASPNMKFEVRRDGPKLVVTWSEPYVKVRASKFGIGITGTLTGLIVHPDRLQAILDGLPDVEFKL